MFTLLEIKRIILLPKNEYLPKIGNRIMTEPTNCVNYACDSYYRKFNKAPLLQMNGNYSLIYCA